MICKLYCPQVEGRHAEGGGRGGEAAEGSLDRVVALVTITRMLLESMDNRALTTILGRRSVIKAT
jgi:hypothetical protein